MEINRFRHVLTIIWIAVFVVPTVAGAMTFSEVEVTCPLGGEVFTATLARSGTKFGTFLDFRPFGPIASPTPLAKCPANGFVIYKEEFTDDELRQLTPYVESEDYQSLQKKQTNYYLAAELQSCLKETSKQQIARTLLQATWEVETREQYLSYANEALFAFKHALTEDYAKKNEWLTDQLIAGELERRLGQFAEAKKRFLMLSEREKVSSGTVHNMIQLQLQLIEAEDSEPNLVPGSPK
jgi:hypothetical protein